MTKEILFQNDSLLQVLLKDTKTDQCLSLNTNGLDQHIICIDEKIGNYYYDYREENKNRYFKYQLITNSGVQCLEIVSTSNTEKDYENLNHNDSFAIVDFEMKTYPIISIGEDCFKNNSNFRIDTLPDTINEIKKNAFYGCTSIVDIQLPENLISIGDSAFYNCSSLQNVYFSDNISTIGTDAFKNCKNAVIYLSSTLYDILSDLGRIINDKIDDATVITKESHVITLVSSGSAYVDEMGLNYTINNSENRTLTLTSSPRTLETYPLLEYHDTIFFIPELNRNYTLTEIGDNAFETCTKLNLHSLPDTLQKIGFASFMFSTVEELVIPNSVTEIGNVAFSGSALRKITLPSRLVSLGVGVFGMCYKLEEVIYQGVLLPSIPEECFQWDSLLKSINAMDKVVAIEKHALNGCSGLESIHLGDQVRVIEEGAFNSCTNLKIHMSSTLRDQLIQDQRIVDDKIDDATVVVDK